MLCTNYKGEQELYSPLHYIELQYTILCDVLEKTIIICLYSLYGICLLEVDVAIFYILWLRVKFRHM